MRTEPAGKHTTCFPPASPFGEMNWRSGFLLLEGFGSSFASLCAEIRVLERRRENAHACAKSSSPNEGRSDLGKSFVQNADLS